MRTTFLQHRSYTDRPNPLAGLGESTARYGHWWACPGNMLRVIAMDML